MKANEMHSFSDLFDYTSRRQQN